MTRSKLALALALLPLAAAAAPETYGIDPVHSYPHFAVNHLGMSTIQGRFDRMSGKITVDRSTRTGALEVKIDTASLTTGDAKHEAGSWATKNYGPRSRDEHLRSADFFNVAEFPEATYKSSRLVFSGDNLEAIEGNLTLLGVTKPLKLSITAFKCGPHPFTRKEMCGADAVAVFKRSDFGMKAFVGPVSDEVKLSINVEAYKE
ncbi:YceI family protein [Variovorax terrae]|uniref:YceI family protein n=1 Tax=Variovorax terrae TaxID=2923278 RepID=A0A9X1VQS8_9BURK|nr:YceI family protein [Variovorax terrae]MCJ0761607.1 YceI family protein [Variovorax terrae]